MRHFRKVASSLIAKAIHARAAMHGTLYRHERQEWAAVMRAARMADEGHRPAVEWLAQRFRNIKAATWRDEQALVWRQGGDPLLQAVARNSRQERAARRQARA